MSLFKVLFRNSMRQDRIQIESEIEKREVRLGTNFRPAGRRRNYSGLESLDKWVEVEDETRR